MGRKPALEPEIYKNRPKGPEYQLSELDLSHFSTAIPKFMYIVSPTGETVVDSIFAKNGHFDHFLAKILIHSL